MNRKCAACQATKIMKEFCKDRTQPEGHGYTCKVCKSIQKKEQRRKNGKIYYNSRWTLDSNYLDVYVSCPCDICGTIFLPRNMCQTSCSSCQEIRDYVYSRVSANHGPKRREVSHTDIIEIVKKYIGNDVCCYCRRNFTASNCKSFDHIIPKSLGGTDSHTNINISCLECNQSKSNLPLSEWITLCGMVYHSLGQSSPSAGSSPSRQDPSTHS